MPKISLLHRHFGIESVPDPLSKKRKRSKTTESKHTRQKVQEFGVLLGVVARINVLPFPSKETLRFYVRIKMLLF